MALESGEATGLIYHVANISLFWYNFFCTNYKWDEIKNRSEGFLFEFCKIIFLFYWICWGDIG